jgi:GT2 family glycosyltransferase
MVAAISAPSALDKVEFVASRPTVLRASVILVSYNARSYLDGCLGSVLANLRPDDELILVDNASRDGSADYAASAYPQVKVIRNEGNHGFGAGNNLGAAEAQGQYLVFLNPDTVVEPGWLDQLVAALEADPRAGMATAKILLLADPGRINTCGNDVHYTGLALCRGLGLERQAYPDLGEVAAVSGAAFAVRSALFRALGGFDEDFFLYMEDTDLSWRARLAGYRCLYVPGSHVRHDYGLRFGPQKTYYQERNRYLMLLKTLRWRTWLVLWPSLLLAELVTWGFVLLRDRPRWTNKLRAYAWIARHWGRVMGSRKGVQALRRVDDRAILAHGATRLAYDQTGQGLAARLARRVFDPLFFALHKATLLLVRW